jgi:hypothetical protein
MEDAIFRGKGGEELAGEKRGSMRAIETGQGGEELAAGGRKRQDARD